MINLKREKCKLYITTYTSENNSGVFVIYTQTEKGEQIIIKELFDCFCGEDYFLLLLFTALYYNYFYILL